MDIKRITGFIVFIFLVTTAYSQSFKAEVTAGVTANQVDGDMLGGYNKVGFLGGVGVGIGLGEKWMLNSHVHLVQKGARTSADDFGYMSWRINYISIPVFIDYNVYKNLHVKAGLGADILINSRVDYGGGFGDITDQIRRVTPVSLFALEYRLSEGLGINLSHHYALINIRKNNIYQFTNTIAVSLSVKVNN